MSYINIQVASDIHFEYHNKLYKPIEPKAPILLLCGDIGYPKPDHTGLYWEFLDYYSNKFDKIFIVTGNHEYYQKRNLKNFRYKQCLDINTIDQIIRDECKYRYRNVSFLQCNEEIYNGVRFVGCTLWSDIDKDTFNNMNDREHIYHGGIRKINHDDIIDLYKCHRLWLEKVLFDTTYPTIVLTHHLPSLELIHEKYLGSSFNSGYASNLNYLIEYPVKAWFHGHTHTANHQLINNIPVISNPRGYPSEMTGFDKSEVITIAI